MQKKNNMETELLEYTEFLNLEIVLLLFLNSLFLLLASLKVCQYDCICVELWHLTHKFIP